MTAAEAQTDDTARARRTEFTHPARLLILALAFATAATATDMYLPAFPAIRRAFNATPQFVQLSLSVFLYGSACGQLLFGPISDRWGRRPVLLVGLAAYALASLGCALADGPQSFLVFRSLQGVAAAAGPVLIRAMVADRLERVEAVRMLALLTGLMAFLAMLTPIAGGWLVHNGSWRWIFLVIAGIGFFIVCAGAFTFRETLPVANRLPALNAGTVLDGYLEIARTLPFWGYVLPSGLMFASVFAYVGTNSFLLIDQLGMRTEHHGAVYALAACAFVAGSLTSGRLTQRWGVERLITRAILFGVSAMALASLASATLPLSVPLVVAPGVVMFFGAALVVPAAAASAVSLFPRRAGSASAVAGCTQIALAGVSAGVAGTLVSTSTVPLHLFMLAGTACAALVWRAGRGRRAL